MRQSRTPPIAGQLWLSRPPFLLIAKVESVFEYSGRIFIEYELLDDDGTPLCGRVTEPLEDSWWASFQPLVRRFG